MENKYNILDTDIYVYDIRNDNYEVLRKYFLKYLNDDEINKIEKFKNDNDKIARILSYSLPKIKLAAILNVDPISINIKRIDNCRPYYTDYNYYFSVSHTKNYVAFALSKENIGLDIEERVNRDFKALNYVADPNEISCCKENDDFYTLWTFKESYAKLKGTGITKDLKNIIMDNYKNKQTIFINHLVITLCKE